MKNSKKIENNVGSIAAFNEILFDDSFSDSLNQANFMSPLHEYDMKETLSSIDYEEIQRMDTVPQTASGINDTILLKNFFD